MSETDEHSYVIFTKILAVEYLFKKVNRRFNYCQAEVAILGPKLKYRICQRLRDILMSSKTSWTRGISKEVIAVLMSKHKFTFR